jgi:hypothetical protein
MSILHMGGASLSCQYLREYRWLAERGQEPWMCFTQVQAKGLLVLNGSSRIRTYPPCSKQESIFILTGRVSSSSFSKERPLSASLTVKSTQELERWQNVECTHEAAPPIVRDLSPARQDAFEARLVLATGLAWRHCAGPPSLASWQSAPPPAATVPAPPRLQSWESAVALFC